MHKHKVCEHEIKYCNICDVAYCEKCGKQWYSNTYYISYTPPTTYVGTSEAPKITYDYTVHTAHGKDLE